MTSRLWQVPLDGRIGLPHARFGVVLLLLLALLLLLVGLDLDLGSTRLLDAASVAILIVAIAAAADERRSRRKVIALGVLAAALNGGTLSGFRPAGIEIGPAVSALFAGYTTWLLLGGVVHSKRVTGDVLAGALAAYVMAGLAFAMVYGVVEARVPGSFNLPGGGAASFPDLVYFSFVTLLTIGFGDVTPAGPVVRAVVLVEGLFGVAFTTIVMASLVAAYLQQSRSGPET
jgi:Ion channel